MRNTDLVLVLPGQELGIEKIIRGLKSGLLERVTVAITCRSSVRCHSVQLISLSFISYSMFNTKHHSESLSNVY